MICDVVDIRHLQYIHHADLSNDEDLLLVITRFQTYARFVNIYISKNYFCV